METPAFNVVIADSMTHIPLPNASIYDKNGVAIGMSDNRGVLPELSKNSYPLTVRYIGFHEKTVMDERTDTIFLSENVSELPEVIVESRRNRVLHILAYVREHSTLTTYTDTVFLFREKMVDYMFSTDGETKFKGWSTPRILTCKSYYRFTDENGLDSVSDASHYHFSWSDWIGLEPKVSLPNKLRNTKIATDTLHGKYSPTEIWDRIDDRLKIEIDVLSDTASRKWVPNLSGFFRSNLEFDKFKVKYNYNNIVGDTVTVLDLTGYSFDIESRGRGHGMFRFNKLNEPFYVSTTAEVYILDQEFISVKEARKWDKRDFDIDEIGIYEPMEAPGLSHSILSLIDRVNRIDKDSVRLDYQPDHRMISNNNGRNNFKVGQRALFLLKQVIGVTLYKSRKNFNNNWESFRKGQLKKNNQCKNEK
ncbi:MAG: hypothetical protein K2M27_10440 [Muribaculaceae bacterium]|nr:hypothetical protein [Muribaculaceae bacterium]